MTILGGSICIFCLDLHLAGYHCAIADLYKLLEGMAVAVGAEKEAKAAAAEDSSALSPLEQWNLFQASASTECG